MTNIVFSELIGKISIIGHFKTSDKSTITTNIELSYLMKELLKWKVKLIKKDRKIEKLYNL